jgi:hypothetical protein
MVIPQDNLVERYGLAEEPQDLTSRQNLLEQKSASQPMEDRIKS